MQVDDFTTREQKLFTDYEALINRPNRPTEQFNGVVQRHVDPVLTADHAPPFWRYDLDPQSNPMLLERLGVNSVFNVGAIEFEGKISLVARVEGLDRKSFLAIADSANGIDGFRFRDYPVQMPESDESETNVYDMRLVRHEDGWIYGLFCAERHDERAPHDPSAAIARCGIARTKDLQSWERLPNLKAPAAQHRNYVLHPEFIQGSYAFYTRPMSDFKATGTGSGIGWGLCHDIEQAVIIEETLIDPVRYHTIKEGKNGLGPAPLKTQQGWLQLAHGVWHNADGLRYVLYLFLTDLQEPWKVIGRPSGYFMAPQGAERVGDVSDVLFANGWVMRKDGEVLIYYGSSDTRTHVARSHIDRLLDYVVNTPEDGYRHYQCTKLRCELIEKNLRFMEKSARYKARIYNIGKP